MADDDTRRNDLALQAMQHALRSIVAYGDCQHDDGRGPPPNCTCPICVARGALRTEEALDWRYQGHLAYRCNTHPREARIIAAWKAYLQRKPGSGSPDTTLSGIIGDDPTPRDWYIATTIVQWLATNCGMSVLDAAGFKYDWKEK